MKKIINKVHGEGLIYENTLELRVSGEKAKNPGSNYISGKLALQITPDNIVTFDFLESEMTKRGTENKKYKELKDLVGAPSVLSDGESNATSIKIDSAIDLNDFVPKDSEEIISAMRNFNGFIHKMSYIEEPKATFEIDMLITGSKPELEKDDDGNLVENGYLEVRGFTFSFKGDILPVKLVVRSEKGVAYFKNLPDDTFTKVWGVLDTEDNSIKRVEPSAFGEDKVVTYTKTKKSYVLTGANTVPYEFGTEETLTVDEVKEALAARKVYLEGRRANSQNSTSNSNNTSVKTDAKPKNKSFDF